ncbi:hypothetical protein PFY12_14590 [Chryseobacterium camelliae]|uniref:Uncharacterized protein n=1 Tax=Chryseobacterium camelliae TaxID=1265445 RepID=A0ABY7QLZ2_9FLAO|nr:hypothetical protein [Chryseobacterium camelliae]WBV60253.1 hypothetical protein PFY12_14590 [Chryseobacterium camelliae]
MATYTTTQIENARKAYNEFLQYRSIESYEPEYIGYAAAEQRCDFHNNIVKSIIEGNKELEKEQKLFFLNLEVKKDRKKNETKAKLQANKEQSSDVLEPIKSIKKLGEFSNWLNDSKNPFRKEHFSKKYTAESVSAFLKTL